MGVRDFVDVSWDEIGRRDCAPKAVAEDADLAYVSCHFAHAAHCAAGFDESGGDRRDGDDEDACSVVVVFVH
jgi:hypothetical protein